jgi:hypothetical protein
MIGQNLSVAAQLDLIERDVRVQRAIRDDAIERSKHLSGFPAKWQRETAAVADRAVARLEARAAELRSS